MNLLLLALFACGSDDPCAGRRDLSDSPAGLDLTAEEHPDGWGRADCFQCHQRWTIHTTSCIEGVQLDTAAFADADEASCVACHGANGVAAWTAMEDE